MMNPGTRLGPYEILSAAGAGGMGEVYRARDTRLDRIVALKVLPVHLAEREDLRERFQVEARAIAKLQHPNICSVFDVGEEGGVDYLILEYLEGETLEKRIERGALPVSEALQIATQIAAGLDAAHRADITHRDLKPANVMLTKAGAKLLDFGLAKLEQKSGMAAVGGTSLATMTQALTVEGTIMGTFQYMAPEQLEGADADARTDLFAFGLVLYEMITGRKAFQGKSQATLISAIMTADPAAVSTIQPLTPPALERVILRCLLKDPDERWQTARDLLRELEWIALGGSQVGVPAPVAAKRRGFRFSWAVAALAVASTAAVSWLHFREQPEPRPVGRFTVPLPSMTFAAGPVISPDGSKALFWLGPGGNAWQIFVYSLATGEYRPLPATEQARAAAWSPDSRYIAALNPVAGELRKIEVAGGGFSVLAKTTAGNGIAWSHDGIIIYEGGDHSVYRVSAEGGAPRKVFTLGPNESAGILNFLPDGDHFLFSVQAGTGSETRVASLRGGSPKVILQSTAGVFYTREGQLLFVRNNALLAQPFDFRKLELSGAPSTLVPSVNAAGFRLYSASENGVLMFHPGSASSGQRMTWFDRTGHKTGDVGAADAYTNPAISPDGKRVAVGVGDLTAKKRDIWIFDLVRGGSYRLTFDPADDFNPVWSPDGQYIVFGSDRKGKRDLYRKLASGTGEDEVIWESQTANNTPESWSHDGRYIWVAQSPPGKQADLYLLTLADRKLEKYIATPFIEDKAQLSPDGRWLAYHSAESSRDEVYLQPFPATGERWQVSTAGGTEPQWRGDGKELFFVVKNAIAAVDIKPAGKSVEIGIPHTLFETRLPAISIRNRYVPAADGQKFLVLYQEEQAGAAGFETIMNWPELLKRK